MYTQFFVYSMFIVLLQQFMVFGLIDYLQQSFILYCSLLIPHTLLSKIDNLWNVACLKYYLNVIEMFSTLFRARTILWYFSHFCFRQFHLYFVTRRLLTVLFDCHRIQKDLVEEFGIVATKLCI